MVNYLQLARWPNLAMIVLLQYLVRYALASPLLEFDNKGLLLTGFEFFVLVLSCVCIAAGGYVINDIEDADIDAINKPERKIIGSGISKESAHTYYLVLTFLGIAGGFFLTYVQGYSYIAMINMVCAGLLYFYSTSYKCIPLLGNVIISLLSALVIFMVILPEPFAKENPAVMLMVGAYMFFSFITTFIRELIKDIEDLEGDRKNGCQTLPTWLGPGISKFTSIVLTLLLLVLLAGIQILSRQWETPLPFYFILVFVDFPLLILCIKLMKAREKSDYSNASLWLKITMFTGIISLAVFYYSFN
ncbi:MAG: geranylgeranylglycerol-phosphate geranylgeranyltransferase [Bacteroidia bacterium]|nr:geranylgeranylglycerol-phosphate geranylgeranyltransferase [Bacteroidia bacterium]